MKSILVMNESNEQILIINGTLANHFPSRLRGLLGLKKMEDGQGLMIVPCNMVHTIGMKISIDVLFVSEEGYILDVIHSMKPGKVSPRVKNAKYVIELPPGKANDTDTVPGHMLSVYNVK